MKSNYCLKAWGDHMSRYSLRAMSLIVAWLSLLAVSVPAQDASHNSSATSDTSSGVDHRYYYLDSWMGAIGLPDDPFKTLVDADGTFWTEQGKNSLRQGFYPLAVYESPLKIHGDLRGGTERVDQHMYSSRVPVSIAHKRQGDVAVEETLFFSRASRLEFEAHRRRVEREEFAAPASPISADDRVHQPWSQGG